MKPISIITKDIYKSFDGVEVLKKIDADFKVKKLMH